MKIFKVLPVAVAVAAVMGSMPAMAETNVELLEQRIQELENRLSSYNVEELQEKVAQAELASASDFDIVFSGYARYGVSYDAYKSETINSAESKTINSAESKTINSADALNGNATGRLGNEGFGGEYQIATTRRSESGAKWDLVLMVEQWGDDGYDLGLKKMYAGVSNIFECQPGIYIWAGRDFHQRFSTDLNDYYWMTHDGQGGGIKNIDLGFGKLDLGLVENNGGGSYAATSRLAGINLGGATLNLHANYGFKSDSSSKKVTSMGYQRSSGAYQLAADLSYAGQRIIVRYADNAKDSVFDRVEGQSALIFSFDGAMPITEKLGVQYLAAYQMLDVDKTKVVDSVGGVDLSRDNYNVIVRPTYAWNDVHSTWFEAGYNVVDFNDLNKTNSSWKVTLSQNIAINAFDTGTRPMIRFYATYGDRDNEYRSDGDGYRYEYDENDVLITTANKPKVNNPKILTFGAMFEAWW